MTNHYSIPSKHNLPSCTPSSQTSQLPYNSQIEAVVDFILNKPAATPAFASSMRVSIPLPTKPPSPPVLQAPPMSPPRFYKEGTAMSPPSAGLKSLWNKVEQEKATSAVKRQVGLGAWEERERGIRPIINPPPPTHTHYAHTTNGNLCATCPPPTLPALTEPQERPIHSPQSLLHTHIRR